MISTQLKLGITLFLLSSENVPTFDPAMLIYDNHRESHKK